jgi:hypothetical protein
MSVNSVALSLRKGAKLSCCNSTIKPNLLLTEEFLENTEGDRGR